MDYLDVKALSEVLEGYDELFALLRRTRRDLLEDGRVEAGELARRAGPAVRALCRGRSRARRRYRAACRQYLDQLPPAGRAA